MMKLSIEQLRGMITEAKKKKKQPEKKSPRKNWQPQRGLNVLAQIVNSMVNLDDADPEIILRDWDVTKAADVLTNSAGSKEKRRRLAVEVARMPSVIDAVEQVINVVAAALDWDVESLADEDDYDLSPYDRDVHLKSLSDRPSRRSSDHGVPSIYRR